MPKNPPDDMPRLTPYLFYKDVPAAMTWLEEVFGFQPRFQLPDPNGVIVHAEMTYRESVMMMGVPCPDQGGSSPADSTVNTQALYIYVDDVDAHYAQAKSAGAERITEPENMFWGDRMYNVYDLEGHGWSFAQHVEDIAPEDMKPTFG